ncbi:MAG TPA: nitroreductase family deazaflavin-dependent oxidoreductase [Pseudonocardiaceae bacterium]
MKRNALVSRVYLGLGTRSWFLALTRIPTVALDKLLLRRSEGRVAIGDLLGASSLLLTTTGRRSGQPSNTPLFYFPHDSGYVVVASNFGRPNHPGWSFNLLADPRATVAVDGRTVPVQARLLEGDERSDAWARVIRFWPGYDAYRARAGRELRIFVLEPTGAEPASES